MFKFTPCILYSLAVKYPAIDPIKIQHTIKEFKNYPLTVSYSIPKTVKSNDNVIINIVYIPIPLKTLNNKAFLGVLKTSIYNCFHP